MTSVLVLITLRLRRFVRLTILMSVSTQLSIVQMRYRFPVLLVLSMLVVAGCASDQAPTPRPALPEGSAQRGMSLFETRVGNLPECSSCHSLDGSRGTGPTLLGYGESAGSRRSGQSASEFTVNSILQPGTVITSGFSNIMPSNYSQHLSDQDLADLVAYVLSQ